MSKLDVQVSTASMCKRLMHAVHAHTCLLHTLKSIAPNSGLLAMLGHGVLILVTARPPREPQRQWALTRHSLPQSDIRGSAPLAWSPLFPFPASRSCTPGTSAESWEVNVESPKIQGQITGMLKLHWLRWPRQVFKICGERTSRGIRATRIKLSCWWHRWG